MYARIENNAVIKYPYTIRDLRQEYPDVSFPRDYLESTLNEYGVFSVTPTNAPVVDAATQKAVEIEPVFANGTWNQVWEIQALSVEELEEYKTQQRPATAEQKLRTILAVPAIRRIKTLADAEAVINSQVSNLETAKSFMAKLLFATVNTARYVDSRDDTLFPVDE